MGCKNFSSEGLSSLFGKLQVKIHAAVAACAKQNMREKIKQECKKDVECNLPLFANKKRLEYFCYMCKYSKQSEYSEKRKMQLTMHIFPKMLYRYLKKQALLHIFLSIKAH